MSENTSVYKGLSDPHSYHLTSILLVRGRSAAACQVWYDSCMLGTLPSDALDSAADAVTFAQLVRKRHARKTELRSKQRRSDIQLALDRIHEAMAPIKSEIGRFPYGATNPIAEAKRDEIRAASLALQRERRKLWKMLNPTPKRKKAPVHVTI
jgi:hypothetical protein